MTVTDTGGRHWHENWGGLHHDSPELAAGWAHHGLAVTATGEIIGFHPSEPALTVFDCDGAYLRSIPCDVAEGHGLTIALEPGGDEALWVADCGFKVARQADGTYAPVAGGEGWRGRATKMSLDGEVLMTIRQPDIAAYKGGRFFPTGVAVFEERRHGNGDIWLTDGYGAGLVHRFDRAGEHLDTITGEDGAGRFDCPHNVFVDHRREEPELYVADRGNARIQVYGLDGAFRRVVGEGVLNSPSAMAVDGDHLIVAELNARLAVLDAHDQFVEYLGANDAVVGREAWPNALDANGTTVRPPLEAGLFNSPHGLAVGSDGAILVAEWLIGGRQIKLGATS